MSIEIVNIKAVPFCVKNSVYYVEKNMINFKYTVISGLPQDVSARSNI